MKLISFCSLFACCGIAQAQSTLSFSVQFSNFFGDGTLSGIADEDSNTAPGLSWGILIAETGSDFSGPLVTELGISTADGAELADGFRYFSGNTTITTTFGNDPDGGAEGVVSTSETIVVTDFLPEYNTGDAFALIWLGRGIESGDTLQVGDSYGILTNDAFLVPSDNSSNAPFGSNFNGPDPIRPASLTVQGVPEPSSLMLGLLSGVALLRRRRC